MLRFKLKRNAQTTLEYAILIGIIAAALVGMQVYLKRGYQGKLRDGADSMGEQFSPDHTDYTYTTNSQSNSTETFVAGTTTTEIHRQHSERTGSENVADSNSEGWFEE